MTDPLIKFDNLTGGYGAMTIIRNVSGAVLSGECLCVLGRNGVGKSTLMKLLSGHLRLMSGEIRMGGRSAGKLSSDKRHKLGLSFGMQERPIFDTLSVQENLTLMQSSQSLERYDAYLDSFPILKQRLKQTAGTLSGGERKILSFVRTMAEGGAVTLLDEPSEGVQPENIEIMTSHIQDAKSSGRSMIVVEQHLHLAEAIANTYAVLDNGQVVLSGSADDVGREEIVKQISV